MAKKKNELFFSLLLETTQVDMFVEKMGERKNHLKLLWCDSILVLGSLRYPDNCPTVKRPTTMYPMDNSPTNHCPMRTFSRRKPISTSARRKNGRCLYAEYLDIFAVSWKGKYHSIILVQYQIPSCYTLKVTIRCHIDFLFLFLWYFIYFCNYSYNSKWVSA